MTTATTIPTLAQLQESEKRVCPQCRYVIENPFHRRCPRCYCAVPYTDPGCRGCYHAAACGQGIKSK